VPDFIKKEKLLSLVTSKTYGVLKRQLL